MKNVFLGLVLTILASSASAQLILPGGHGRENNDLARAADQFAAAVGGIDRIIDTRYNGIEVQYEVEQLLREAQNFAWEVRSGNSRDLQFHYQDLRAEYEHIEQELQGGECGFDPQISSYLRQGDYALQTIEECLNGEGGGGPFGQNWVCYAVDNGWEEHGPRAHPGFGRSQFEAQQSAISSCQREHGRCSINSCQITR